MNRFVTFSCGCTAVAVAGLLAGCGASSSSSSPAATHPATSSSASSAPASAASSAAPASAAPTAAQLAAIVLQPGDLPAGWTAGAPDPDSSEAAESAAIATCLGIRNTELDKVALVNSKDFTQGDLDISAQAESYKSESDVQLDQASLSSPKYVACSKQEIAASLPAGTTLDNVSLTLTLGANGGPSDVVGTETGTVTFTQSGQQDTLYTTLVLLTGPRIEGEIDFESGDGPVPVSLQAPIIAKMAGRLVS